MFSLTRAFFLNTRELIDAFVEVTRGLEYVVHAQSHPLVGE
jgi:hypothetical protein